MSRQGFLIQASFRLRSRASGKAVLQLYGRLAEGQTFLLVEDREAPYFFIRTADVGAAAALLESMAAAPVPTTRRTLAGEPVSRVQLAAPAAMALLSQQLTVAGVPTYEADLNPVARYLIDRGVRGSVELHGPSRPGQPAEGVDLVFHNPEISPGSVVPKLKVVALRVATCAQGRLAAVALHGPGGSEVLRITATAAPAAAAETSYADEKALLAGLAQRLRAHDPDVMVGWDVVLTDLAALRAAAQRTRTAVALGRGAGAMQLYLGAGRGRGGPPRAVIAGRMVIDAAALVRTIAPQLSDEALEVVAARVLGEQVPADLRAPQRTLAESPAALAAQLQAEAQALFDLTARLQLIELVAQRSRLCGLPLDRIHASVAAFDYLYLLELGRRGFVAPTFARPTEPVEPVVGDRLVCLRNNPQKRLLNGQIWIATNRGIGQYDGERWRFPKGNYMNVRASALARDGEGRVWVGSDRGVMEIVDENRRHFIGTRTGLLDDKVLNLTVDLRGRVWTLTEKGISIIEPLAP